MVLLYAVVQDRHDHTPTRVAQLPCTFGIQVTTVAVVLWRQKANNLEDLIIWERRSRADKNVQTT